MVFPVHFLIVIVIFQELCLIIYLNRIVFKYIMYIYFLLFSVYVYL